MKFGFFTLLMLTGCANEAYQHRNDLPETRIKPETKQEITYEEILKARGYSQVQYEIPIAGRGAVNNRKYWLSLRSDSVFYLPPDTLLRIRKTLANELYTLVMSDQDICDVTQISICFCKDALDSDNYICDRIPKDSLEIWNGFKVVQLPTGYKRVPLKE